MFLKYNLILFLWVSFIFGHCVPCTGAELQPKDIARIGEKIFANECSLREDCLVHWNQGEDFLSLGIGHFIWYPKDQRGPFEESFPQFLSYVRNVGVSIPRWLNSDGPVFCPWPSRDDFLRNQKDPRLLELREFLAKTKPLQAEFIIKRFRESIPNLLDGQNLVQRQKIERQIHRLMATPSGVFAIIDYSHFKGFGTAISERYEGKGWGLLQVLLAMEEDKGADVLEQFVQKAKEALSERVRRSPKERHEHRWLAGWHNRVDSYLRP